jgi:hypothetical protein
MLQAFGCPLPENAMSLKEAQMLPDAAADAIEALAHLVIFATAEGHGGFAATAMGCLEQLIVAPEARRIIPAQYFDAGVQSLVGD